MRFVFALLAGCCLIAPAHAAREQIRVVGSSTVYPYSATAAEEFGMAGNFKTPIVEATGTGGGFKLFCSGVGDATADIAGASRPITSGERELCGKNGVTKITEIPIGYDGIVFANAKGSAPLEFTKKQIFMALAKELPNKDGKLATNSFQKWSEIDPKLPATPIEVYGPPPTSGTRDAFVELLMDEGCKAFPEFVSAYPDEKIRKKTCGLMREDGRYIDAGEDDNIIVQKLVSNHSAFGIFGYGFLDENKQKVQASKIEGVFPSIEAIENGTYKVSRSLFMYVKGEHVGVVPGMAEFMAEMVGDAAIGQEGYLTLKGLLPLNANDAAIARERAKSLKNAK